ncbi:MAG: DinB family protein [Ignavibacteria bacterium]|nr:DinB family protein [Ignavibacteria bacterium]
MSDIETILTGNLEAVRELIQAAEKAEPIWTQPRAPGKWSAAQVTEHVARALEESANVVAGRPSKFPTFPSIFRPIVRGVFFNRVIRKRTFPKAKTNKPFDPESGPDSPAAAARRLNAAVQLFEKECRTCAGGTGVVRSTIFGDVSVGDYALFQELHTRNHTGQIPSP